MGIPSKHPLFPSTPPPAFPISPNHSDLILQVTGASQSSLEVEAVTAAWSLEQ